MQKETSPDRHLLKRRGAWLLTNIVDSDTQVFFIWASNFKTSLELYKFQFQQHPILGTSGVLKLSSRMAFTVMCLGQALVSIALYVREAISLRKHSKIYCLCSKSCDKHPSQQLSALSKWSKANYCLFNR